MQNQKPSSRTRELLLKRQAIQVAGMLPDDPEDALLVLGYAQDIIEKTFGITKELNGPKNADEHLRLVTLKQPRQSGGGGDGAGQQPAPHDLQPQPLRSSPRDRPAGS